MKVRILIVVVMLFSVFASCKREKLEVIPDDIMRKILVECAFMDSYSKNIIPSQKIDSLSFFEPIFKKYNCTVDNFQFTLKELARRKSNVLEVLIDAAVEELDVARKVAEFRNDLNIDWINRALDSTKHVVYQHLDTIVIKSLDSLCNASITIPMGQKGMYEIKYRYYIDSTDENSVRYLRYDVRDSISGKSDNVSTKWLKYEQDSMLSMDYKLDIDKVDSTSNEIVFEMIYFGNKNKYAKKVNMLIDSAEVVFYYPEDVASKLFMDRTLGLEPLNTLYTEVMERQDTLILPESWWLVSDSLSLVGVSNAKSDSISLIMQDTLLQDSIGAL